MDALTSKILSLFLLFVLTILFGILPHVFIKCKPSCLQNNTYERILQLLNSFAGGVFLGTCLLHLLAEGREELVEALTELNKETDYPIFEACVAVGFFVIVLVDYAAHMCLTSSNHTERKPLLGQTADSNVRRHYGTQSRGGDHRTVQQKLGQNKHNGAAIEEVTRPYGGDTKLGQNKPKGAGTEEVRIRNSSTKHHHDHDLSQPISIGLKRARNIDSHHDLGQLSNISSSVKAILLLVALSFHTVFDGLAVGLQNSSTEVWEIMLAIIIHKSLVAFSLGLQLFTAYNGRPIIAVTLLFVFSVMSPIGLGIGIGVTSGNIDKAANLLTSAILQACATGTFLYVIFFEILRQCFITNRSLWNIVICVVGFSTMAGVKVLDLD